MPTVQENRAPELSELARLRLERTTIDDRLSTLKCEAEALIAKRGPVDARIRELEDRLP